MRTQHLMSGWLNRYNLKCQSIDYSEDDHARRVSFLEPRMAIDSMERRWMDGQEVGDQAPVYNVWAIIIIIIFLLNMPLFTDDDDGPPR